MKLARELLNALKPLELAAYLRSRGWAQSERAAAWTVWRAVRPGAEEIEVILPLDRSLADYLPRLAEVIRALEAFEQRSTEQILEDIGASSADTVRFRFSGPVFDEQSVPIGRGVRIYQHARELLLAAACAAIESRPVLPTRKPLRALEFLEAVRLVPPAGGSYVVAVRSPVPPALGGQDTEAVEEPFERRAVATLAASIEGAHRAVLRAATTATSQPFYEEVGQGVSANLCEALAGLVAESGARRVEVTVSAAPSRPTFAQRRIEFSEDAAPVLREAARVLRAGVPREDFELEGVVTRLERSESDAEGQVTLTGLVDEGLRKVRVSLGREDYALAIEAHRLGKPLRCEGELAREGRAYVLHHPRGVRVGDERTD